MRAGLFVYRFSARGSGSVSLFHLFHLFIDWRNLCFLFGVGVGLFVCCFGWFALFDVSGLSHIDRGV